MVRLLPHQVQVFYIFLPPWQTELDTLWPLLATQEQQRAHQFVQAIDRQRFIISHGTLRQILGEYLGIPPEQVPLQATALGKPYVAGMPIAFNLSHAGQWAAIAVTTGMPVGIDIEAFRPIANLVSLGRHVFSPAERAAFTAIPAADQLSAFFQLWTRKEALLKAIGQGLHLPPTRVNLGFTVEPQVIDCQTALTGPVAGDFTRIALYPLRPDRDYWGALAVAGSGGTIIEQCWLPDRASLI
ncbi:4'-phosphopantetheinyl transferase superfamily protein [Trichothermofontia sichuanensis B231]|uniref:4'-phosphopantetheinyl transferase family protein n=1 Tax=Trichothermofontia sichuanensis TaxID=3045816 RepID=UPI002248695D|nr:4'-phosphopantetheinyl transferase superfamily protein [Trichothermofontia sichuanensis]UZQ54909.1 4'-phosphopantetheinyl transferase superfamily protein [Trichothermofontia sichuanensis B231]